MHPYKTLFGVSKGFYIKGYEVNWGSKFSVSYYVLKFKNIIQVHRGHTMHCFNI